jgi:predicted nucleic acid-binding Zn ribbon protein
VRRSELDLDGPQRADPPNRLGKVIERYLVSQGYHDELRRLSAMERIERCWETVVGHEVAGHARPLRLTNNVLMVAVDHPTWAAQLRLLSGAIREGLAGLLGDDVPGEVVVQVRRG